MRLLLDSHVVYWMLTAPDNLSPLARRVILDSENEVLASVATIYELDFKQQREKLEIPLGEGWRTGFVEDGFGWLRIDAAHMAIAARLPLHHRDPWDRIIVGQAIGENLTVVSVDRALRAYDAPVLW